MKGQTLNAEATEQLFLHITTFCKSHISKYEFFLLGAGVHSVHCCSFYRDTNYLCYFYNDSTPSDE